MGQRILVVDDLEEMRDLIRRALTAHGYEVDVAATLAQARGLNPGGYDALLVDSHLGSEQGADLVEALRAEDPAAVTRCLMMTGGLTDTLPDDVPALTKPFQVGDLTDAVRALLQSSRPREAGWRPDASPDSHARPAAPRPGPSATSRYPPASAGPDPPGPCDRHALELLGLIRRLRAQGREELVGFLHDGPIQELTAAILELQLISRSSPPLPGTAAVRERLTEAARSLRWLIDGPWPFQSPETGLADAIAQRTAWLLAAPAALDPGQPLAALTAAEIPVIADIVELLLFTMLPLGSAARAQVAVLDQGLLLSVELTLTNEPAHRCPATDQAAINEAVGQLAAALGASAQVTSSQRHCRARLLLARQAPLSR